MHILLIDDKVPDPQFGAGFPRAYRLLLSLINMGHKIHFFPNIKRSIGELNIEKLRTYGIEVHDDLNKVPQDVKIIVCSRPHNAHYHLPVARTLLPHAKVIYDTEALWYRRYDLQLTITGKLPLWAYRYDEIGMARQADTCFVVNDIEKKILEDSGAKKVVKLGHALDIHSDGLPFSTRKGVLVVGGILEEDSSNEDGLWVYMENCWEQVRQITRTSLNITGKVTSQRLRTHQFLDVNLLGHVPDLVPLYEENRIFVAYTRFATGIPWKVHEAMAYGIPCVISPLLADQLGVTDGVEAFVGKDWTDAIEKSVYLYSTEHIWTAMRNEGFKLIQRDCCPDNFKKILQATIAELAG